MKRLGALWRIVATGVGYVLFGIGSVLSMACLVPVLYLLPGGARARQRRVRRLVRYGFVLLLGWLRATGVMRLRVEGAASLRTAGARLVLANHPSYLDVVALLSVVEDASCVVKTGVWRNPFLHVMVRAAGYVPNGDPEAALEACVQRLREGATLVIFPQGTRGRDGGQPHFVRGAAHIALRSGVPLVPVLIRCEPPAFERGVPWYRVPPRRFELSLAVQPPLAASSFVRGEEPPAVAARRLTEGWSGTLRKV